MNISIDQTTFMVNHTPRLFSDLVFADPRVESQLRSYLSRASFEHVLLSGPFGTGKSITARLIVEARQRARGISVPHVEQLHAQAIKTNIDAIAKSVNLLCSLYGADTEPFVIIDEVDQLLQSEQQKLRAFMDEMIAGRVILTTNFPDRLDGALRDRCRSIEMLQPSMNQWLPRAQAILVAEGVVVTGADVRAVLAPCTSTRDLMRALWTLVHRVCSAVAPTSNAAASTAATPAVVPMAQLRGAGQI